MTAALRHRPGRAGSTILLRAGIAAFAVAATVGLLVRRGATSATAPPAPPAAKPAAPANTIYGVPRRLLYRGHSQAMAAKSAYLGDTAHQHVLRALDERTEAWEIRGLKYPHLLWGSSGRKEVLLTFDDGPDPETTPKVLDLLKKEKVPAVFFLIGRRAADHPELVRREVAEGHALGNHTWHHCYLTRMEPDCVRAQIEATRNAIREITGLTTPWFRPPGGHYDPEVIQACRALNQTIVLWSDTPGDWLHPKPEAIEARGLRYLKPGAVILLHDTLPETLSMLPDFIHRVRARGFQFAPISRFAPYVQGKPKR